MSDQDKDEDEEAREAALEEAWRMRCPGCEGRAGGLRIQVTGEASLGPGGEPVTTAGAAVSWGHPGGECRCARCGWEGRILDAQMAHAEHVAPMISGLAPGISYSAELLDGQAGLRQALAPGDGGEGASAWFPVGEIPEMLARGPGAANPRTAGEYFAAAILAAGRMRIEDLRAGGGRPRPAKGS